MAEYKKPVMKQTPVGTAAYPWLTKPDTKFNSEGEYHVKMRFDKEDVADLMEELQDMADAALADAEAAVKKDAKLRASVKKKHKKGIPCNLPFVELEDDEGNLTGEVEFNFKLKATGKTQKGEQFTQRPDLFDARGKQVNPNAVAIRGGSKLRIAFQPIPYFTVIVGAGVSLRLRAAKIIELVEGNAAASYGFGDEEEGFAADESGSAPFDEDEDTTTSTEDDDAEDDGSSDF